MYLGSRAVPAQASREKGLMGTTAAPNAAERGDWLLGTGDRPCPDSSSHPPTPLLGRASSSSFVIKLRIVRRAWKIGQEKSVSHESWVSP